LPRRDWPGGPSGCRAMVWSMSMSRTVAGSVARVVAKGKLSAGEQLDRGAVGGGDLVAVGRGLAGQVEHAGDGEPVVGGQVAADEVVGDRVAALEAGHPVGVAEQALVGQVQVDGHLGEQLVGGEPEPAAGGQDVQRRHRLVGPQRGGPAQRQPIRRRIRHRIRGTVRGSVGRPVLGVGSGPGGGFGGRGGCLWWCGGRRRRRAAGRRGWGWP